jgi:hypothetical protein
MYLSAATHSLAISSTAVRTAIETTQSDKYQQQYTARLLKQKHLLRNDRPVVAP